MDLNGGSSRPHGRSRPAADEATPGTRRAAAVTAVTAGVVIAEQIGAKAVRDALFLSSHPARDLPKVMLVAAAVSLVAVFAMTRALSRVGPGRAVPFTFAVSTVLFVAEWAILPHAPRAVAVVTYLHVAVLGGVAVSGFWSVVTERFDPRTAKQVIGRINAGGALGGLVGGLLVQRCASWLDIRTMLLGLAIGNGLSGVCVSILAGEKALPRVVTAAGPLEGLRILKAMPYLRLLGALVALTGAAAALCDYAFKTVVATRFERGEAMAGFFGLFYGITSFTTFVVQAGFAKRALNRLGLAGTIAILPGGVLLAGLVGASFTRLVTVVALRGVEATLSHSLFRSAYELFYTPLSPEKKRPTKAIVDVAIDRAGDAAASAVVLLAVLAIPERATSLVIGVAVVASALAIWISFRLHAGYVATLADELRASAIVLAPEDVTDATTRSTLAETFLAIDRETLMHQVQELRDARGSSPLLSTPPASPIVAACAREDAREIDPLVARIRDLLSSDVSRSLRALAMPLDPKLVPTVISLVAKPELRGEALSALRRIHARVSGQLADVLLDARTPVSVRMSMPPLVALAGNQRAADALVDGLSDLRLDIRARCASVLAQMCERRPELQLSRTLLVALAARDLDGLSAVRAHRDPILTHVFDVLALAFGEKTLRLAWVALSTGDERLHGTALEYLENVLPATLCARLWPLLGDRPVERAAPRPREIIADDLRASMAARSPQDDAASQEPSSVAVVDASTNH
jgi:AAA family ATP:ADP antiporter